MVEVYESPVMEPGVYQKIPDKTTWSAPGFTDLPNTHDRYSNFGGRNYLPWQNGPPTDQIEHIDSSNDWYLALEYGQPASIRKDRPFFNIPMAGHVPPGLNGRNRSIPKPCDFANISWAYMHENCFENTVILNNFKIAETYQFYDELGINQQP